jgi:hypothetical protein
MKTLNSRAYTKNRYYSTDGCIGNTIAKLARTCSVTFCFLSFYFTLTLLLGILGIFRLVFVFGLRTLLLITH